MTQQGGATLSYIIAASNENISKIDLQYPQPTGEEESLLFKRVIPSIAKDNDYSLFHLGRSIPGLEVINRSRRRTTIVEPQDLEIKSIELYVYEMNDEGDMPAWEMVGDDMMVAFLEPYEIQIIDDSDQTEIATIAPHFDLEFTELEDLFACVLCGNGTILGLRFQNLEDEIEFLVKIEDMCEKIAQTKEAKKEEADLPRCVGVNLNCVSLIRKNNAFCFCTEFDYIYAFLPLLETAFDYYLSNPSENTVKEIYETINSLSLPSHSLFSLDLSLAGKNIKFQVPRLSVVDQLWPSNFRNLIGIFKQDVFKIYNSVLAEKRIVFYGSKCLVSDICNCVISSALMVAPVFGLLKELVHPFTTLATHFFKSHKYIAGVCEEEVLKRTEYWDVLCNIDNGTVTWGNSVDNSFQQESLNAQPFIRPVLIKLGQGEGAVQKILRKYTRRFVDGSVGRGYFSKPEELTEWSQTVRRRTLFWSASQACERWEKLIESRSIKDFSFDKLIQQFAFASTLDDNTFITSLDKIVSTASTPDRIKEIKEIIYDYDCLNTIASGMLHTTENVRNSAKNFLYHMKYLDDSELNPLFKLAYKRATKKAAGNEN